MSVTVTEPSLQTHRHVALQGKVLVVEDDSTLREALCDTLMIAGYQVSDASDGISALSAVDEDKDIAMVLSDVRMPNMDGHQFLNELNQRRPEMPVLMMTAFGSVDGAVDAMRHGAIDYLQKPVPRNVLLEHVAAHLPPCADGEAASPDFVAQDARSREIVRLAERIASTDATVMINGESGTGKEVLARFIHARSARHDRPFVAINCAAIPEPMLEATLFGHEKGAFTGAHKSLPGKFEQANGGTLLLDEITEMDFDLQAKLLRVLQEREVERIGGLHTIDLDVRVIATTNRDLTAEVRAGRFREDLFYRLNVFPVELSPLRERPDDILPIAEKLLREHVQAGGGVKVFSDDAKAALRAHAWPGNVRELGNVVQRASVLSVTATVTAESLGLQGLGGTMQAVRSDAMGVPRSAPPGAAPQEPGLKQRERDLILETLGRFGGNRKQTAEALGLSSRTLRYKLARMREQGIAIPPAWHRGF